MIQKVGLLVCLEGNQAKGPWLRKLLLARDGSGLPPRETRPDFLSSVGEKNIYIKEETKNILLNQSEKDI